MLMANKANAVLRGWLGVMGKKKDKTILHDTFTGANGDNLHGRTPDTKNNGNTWAVTAGAFDIQGNQANNNGGVAGFCLIDCGKSDVKIGCDLIVVTGNANAQSLSVRYVDVLNRWSVAVIANSGRFSISEVTAGTSTERAATEPGALTGSHAIVITANGQSIKATIDGGNEISYSSTSHLAGTIYGLRTSSANGMKYDNYKVESL
jgi:hypothetical protein